MGGQLHFFDCADTDARNDRKWDERKGNDASDLLLGLSMMTADAALGWCLIPYFLYFWTKIKPFIYSIAAEFTCARGGYHKSLRSTTRQRPRSIMHGRGVVIRFWIVCLSACHLGITKLITDPVTNQQPNVRLLSFGPRAMFCLGPPDRDE